MIGYQESQRAPCPNPRQDPTTRVVEANGTVIYYTCRAGFRFESGDLHRLCDTNGTWSGRQPVCTVDSIMPKAYLVMLIVGAIVTVFLACIPYDFYRFRKRKKKVRDHQERLSLVTRIAPGHAKVVVEAVSSEDGDGHNANQPRKFGFKSLLSVFKFMAGGKLKAGGPNGSHSDVGGGESHGDMEESFEDTEISKSSRSNGYRSVPTSSLRSSRGQPPCDADGKDDAAQKTSRSAKSLVMTPYICRHKSCEHQVPSSTQGRAPGLQRSSSDNPPHSYSSLEAPLPVSSHSAVAISGEEKEETTACSRHDNRERALTLELTEVISPASESGTPTPTFSASSPKNGNNVPLAYSSHNAGGATASGIEQSGVMYPYAYSPDYEEIETPRRAPSYFRGGNPPPTSRTNSSNKLIMGGAFGGKQSRQQHQASSSYSSFTGGRSLHQHQTDYDYESHSFSSQKPNYGTGAVPKQNSSPRSGLLVFQKASEMFHRRLEAKRSEESGSLKPGHNSKSPGITYSTPTSEDHWSFTEAPSTARNPSSQELASDKYRKHSQASKERLLSKEGSASDKHRKHSQASKERALSKEVTISMKSPTKPPSSEKKTKTSKSSRSPSKEDQLPVKSTSISHSSRRSTLAAPAPQHPMSSKNRRFHRSMARSYSQHGGDEDYLQTASLLDPSPPQVENLPPHISHLTCLSREEVFSEDAQSDSEHQPRYSMPYVAESPTMQDEERSLRFSFCPISSPKDSFDSVAQEEYLSLQDSHSLFSAALISSSKEPFDSGQSNFPDLISNEMCSLTHTSATKSPSRDTLACSNSSGKTTPEGSNSTVVLNTLVTTPQEEPTFYSKNTHPPLKALSFEDQIPNTSHHISSKDRLAPSKTSQTGQPIKSITPTSTRHPQTSLHPGLKPLTRAGSCSSPLDSVCLAPPMTSPTSSTSSPDVLQLRNENTDRVTLAYHKTSKPRLSRSGLPLDSTAHVAKPNAQYKGTLFARHYSLENP